MKFLPSMLAALALTAVASAPAMANLELAQKKACLACHSVDNKIVGPAYKDVAKKYRGQKGIEAKLAEKIIKGGKGSWGEVAMPANTQVNEAEAKQLVAWIMSLK
jgi:cytochrome c